MLKLTFPKALLVSFLWHIFCLFAIVIVVAPVTVRKGKFSKINFIGAILDEDTFSYYKAKSNFGRARKKDIFGKLAGKEMTRVPFSEERLRHARLTPYLDKPYSNTITEIIKEEKDLPQDASLLIEKLGLAHSPSVKSEAANRQILFKPPTPVVNRAFQVGKVPSKGEKFQIKLRFLVSPDGKVVFIEKVKSCGYPDIDLVAIRYMKKWQFAPLNPDKPKRNQEGIMLLELEAL